jgi:hypothetical protein
MEEVHLTHTPLERVFCRQFTGGADGIGPIELPVRPVAESRFLFGKRRANNITYIGN